MNVGRTTRYIKACDNCITIHAGRSHELTDRLESLQQQLTTARPCAFDAEALDMFEKSANPLLVHRKDDEQAIIGIITPFDLL